MDIDRQIQHLELPISAFHYPILELGLGQRGWFPPTAGTENEKTPILGVELDCEDIFSGICNFVEGRCADGQALQAFDLAATLPQEGAVIRIKIRIERDQSFVTTSVLSRRLIITLC